MPSIFAFQYPETADNSVTNIFLNEIEESMRPFKGKVSLHINVSFPRAKKYIQIQNSLHSSPISYHFPNSHYLHTSLHLHKIIKTSFKADSALPQLDK